MLEAPGVQRVRAGGEVDKKETGQLLPGLLSVWNVTGFEIAYSIELSPNQPAGVIWRVGHSTACTSRIRRARLDGVTFASAYVCWCS